MPNLSALAKQVMPAWLTLLVVLAILEGCIRVEFRSLDDQSVLNYDPHGELVFWQPIGHFRDIISGVRCYENKTTVSTRTTPHKFMFDQDDSIKIVIFDAHGVRPGDTFKYTFTFTATSAVPYIYTQVLTTATPETAPGSIQQFEFLFRANPTLTSPTLKDGKIVTEFQFPIGQFLGGTYDIDNQTTTGRYIDIDFYFDVTYKGPFVDGSSHYHRACPLEPTYCQRNTDKCRFG